MLCSQLKLVTSPKKRDHSHLQQSDLLSAFLHLKVINTQTELMVDKEGTMARAEVKLNKSP